MAGLRLRSNLLLCVLTYSVLAEFVQPAFAQQLADVETFDLLMPNVIPKKVSQSIM